MTNELSKFFKQQITKATQEKKLVKRKYNVVAILRIFYFLAAVVATVYVTDKINSWLGILLGLILMGLFAYLIKIHLKIGWQKNYLGFIENVNEQERQALISKMAAKKSYYQHHSGETVGSRRVKTPCRI